MSPTALVLGCSGPVLDAAERDFFRDADPWGFILFGRNVTDPAQLRALTGALREAVGRDAPILVDQEGGRVARLRPPHWRGWPDPLEACAALPDGAARAEAMRLRYRLIAHELHAVGIDVNCAPCLDAARAETHPFLRSRCLGSESAEIAAIGRAVAEGLLAGGVLPVVKHAPGHGRARADSHKALPVVDAPRAALDADFAPFRVLADLPLAMTAHVRFTALDAERAGTLSPAVIAVIRAEIGFGGCLMTDDISMGALDGPVAARAGAAFAAGCDLVLHCNGEPEEMAALAGAAPRLAGQAAMRAGAALAARRDPDGADPAALRDALAELETGHAG